MAIATSFAAIVMLSTDSDAARATPSPSDRCESGKNNQAGKYWACVGKAERRLILTNDTSAYTLALSKCVSKFDAAWLKFENAAAAQGASCPSENDGPEIQDFLDSCSESVGVALAGGVLPNPAQCQTDLTTCQGDLATTEADLATCNGDLGTCNGDLGTCNGDLTTCNGDLGTCNADLGTCNADLTAAQGNLATCNGDLGTCNADLGTCNGDLGTCNADLGTCNGDLTTCNADLGTCNADLGTCNTDLTTAQGDLATCNGDLGTCTADLASCEAKPVGQPLQTGQTICYDASGGTGTISCTGSGQDAAFHMGAARSYTDNGNGTITDDTTGLMWEKLSDDGSIHDQDTTYTWPAAIATKIAALNTAVFAGHGDWRLPNRYELETLTFLGADSPATDLAFNTGCVPDCSVTTCSCTRSNFYWTSTTYHPNPANAWIVGFSNGNTNSNIKSSLYYVRAVRGGS